MSASLLVVCLRYTSLWLKNRAWVPAVFQRDAPRPHEILCFCIIRTSHLPSFLSLSGFIVGHRQCRTISEGCLQSCGCSAQMAQAMSGEPGFPGKSLPAWSVHSRGVGGRGQPQPEEPPCSVHSLQPRPHGSPPSLYLPAPFPTRGKANSSP